MSFVLVSSAVAVHSLHAQQIPTPTKPDEPFIQLPTVTIVGAKENIESLPGSAAYADAEAIRTHAYDDINQVLFRMPGVYVRQEDGYGLFPNISLRGVSTTRSSKISMMEDGIPTAPAPYAAPAAYYSPTTGRMSAIEVLKGSAQIRHGPQTTGGAINYLSTPIPKQQSGYLGILAGSDNEWRLHGTYGNTHRTGAGEIGYVVEGYYRITDGFKDIDPAPGETSRDAGFTRFDPMVKVRFTPDTAMRQTIEFKYGRSSLDANETYLGLTDADFRANPNRRYMTSRFDNVDTSQQRMYLRYHFEPSDGLAITATAYRNDFSRAWYKLNDARLAGGEYRNLSQILAGEDGDDMLGVLRGGTAGDLRVRNNGRSYDAKGAELRANYNLITGEYSHRFEASVRYHEDDETRFQRHDIYSVNETGAVTNFDQGIDGTQDNRTSAVDAWAFYLQDQISNGRLTVTPGIRYERINFTNTRRSTTPFDFDEIRAGYPKERSLNLFAPGIGFNYRASENISYLGGVYRGFSIPSASAVTGGLNEETSLGWEAGVRYNDRNAVRAEAIAFLTSFSDMIVPNNLGGGGVETRTENVGEVRTLGVEMLVGWDPAAAAGRDFSNPWTLAFTWTDATLRNDVNASGSGGSTVEGIFAGGRKGNKVPYIPDVQVSFGTSLDWGRWSFGLNSVYVPDTYGTANNTDNLRQGADADGAYDARFGKTDSYFLVDFVVRYDLSEHATLRAGVTNLLNDEYIASRLPHGPRPGKPRTTTAGVDIRF